MDAFAVIGLLKDPPTLLRKCMLIIAGGSATTAPANGQAAVATFRVSMKDKSNTIGFTTGLSGMIGKTRDREAARFMKLGGPAKATPGTDEFNAYYIPMVQTSDAATGSSHYSLPTDDGPDFMITSKLSGCTFGVGSSVNGATLVSHIKPNTDIAHGPGRAANLSSAVTGGFDSMTGQVRKGVEYTDYASVIGYRSDGAWKFYMQAVDTGKNLTHVISKVQVVKQVDVLANLKAIGM